MELARYDAEDVAERQSAVAASKGGRWRRWIRREESIDQESWTRKNQASIPGGKWWVSCYKAHAFCDAVTELPIVVAVTAGSQGDTLMLPRWLNRFRRTLTGSVPWFAPVTGATMPARIMPFRRS